MTSEHCQILEVKSRDTCSCGRKLYSDVQGTEGGQCGVNSCPESQIPRDPAQFWLHFRAIPVTDVELVSINKLRSKQRKQVHR